MKLSAVRFLWPLCAGLAISVSHAAGSPDPSEPRQSETKRSRPKICLVLSGGGARGAAHVGVLKVLEANRVPIDCIAGTSMGALVGASYATGTSIPEMEAIVDSISTELLFKERPPREEQPMRVKRDDFSNLFGPDIGVVDNSLQFPKGIVSGVQLETVLRKLTKVKGYLNFDQLPIPFRAIATDLVTGKEVVFSQGELANVMRASMSVPGAIAPAEFDGMMLVDGMLTSNLPVQTARAMGADIVIAVNVGTPLLPRDKLNSIFGVTGQMLSILTEQNVQVSIASLKPTDILISPELGDFSTADFDNLLKIVPLGAQAAEKAVSRLSALSLSPQEYAELRDRQLIALAPDERKVDEIRFAPMKRVNPATTEALMETRKGEPIDQGKLDSDMRHLYGSGDFEHVNYRLKDEGGKHVLVIDAVEKTWGPNYLRFGLGLSTDFQGESYYNILARYRRTWVNALGAEWRTQIQLGNNSSLYSEFYQPLNAADRYFVAPYISLERQTPSLFQGDAQVAQYDLASSIVGVDFGLNFNRYGVLRVGALSGVLTTALQTGSPALAPPAGTVSQGGVVGRITLDQMDSVYFPRSGWGATASVYNSTNALGAADNYTRYTAIGSAAFSFGEHTLNLGVNFGGKIGSDSLPVYDQFQWGGFLKQSGFRTGQLLGENLQFGRLMYYRRILRGSLLEGAYGGVSLEVGKVTPPAVSGNPTGLLQSGALFVGIDTPIGPAYFGYGKTLNGPGSFYFYLGRPF
mgnify:CR=1 FL=1